MGWTWVPFVDSIRLREARTGRNRHEKGLFTGFRVHYGYSLGTKAKAGNMPLPAPHQTRRCYAAITEGHSHPLVRMSAFSTCAIVGKSGRQPLRFLLFAHDAVIAARCAALNFFPRSLLTRAANGLWTLLDIALIAVRIRSRQFTRSPRFSVSRREA
jgi:hypothetical protein